MAGKSLAINFIKTKERDRIMKSSEIEFYLLLTKNMDLFGSSLVRF